MPKARLYPLVIFVPGKRSISGPTTDEEKASWEAGFDGSQNPNPDNERCSIFYSSAVASAKDFEYERAWMRRNAHKF